MTFKKKLFIFFILLTATAFILSEIYNNKTKYFEIKKISLNKELVNSSKENIENISKKYLKGKSFFNFKIDYLILELNKVEWVRNVDIRRVYPNEVSITIEEHQPVAIWNNKRYINNFGELFEVKIIKKNLPLLQSDEDRINEIFDYFYQFNENLRLNNLEYTINKIEENEIRSVTIFLTSGLYIKLGSKNVKNKINLFFKVYKSLKTRDLKKIRYIDMRYSNGFSLRLE